MRSRLRRGAQALRAAVPLIGVAALVVASTTALGSFAADTGSAANSFAAAAVFGSDTFRVTTYEPAGFTGTTHDLDLNHPLEGDYLVMITGAATGGITRGPDSNLIRVTADPFGTGSLAASGSPDVLRLARPGAAAPWAGTVTVIEVLDDQAGGGFRLLDVVEVPLVGAATSGSVGSAPWTDPTRVVPFGGLRGGGVNVSSAASAAHPAGFGRVYPSGPATIVVERDLTGATAADAVHTVYVVEFGSDWDVQHVVVTGSAGGGGADAVGEYDTAPITPVTREHAFVVGWGHTSDGGIGDAFSGTLVTLGDGVTQLAVESQVAVGQEYADTRVVDVYVLEHADMSVDHRFKPDGHTADLALVHPVDMATGAETYSQGEGIAVLASAGMKGVNGGWPVLYGTDPTEAVLQTAISEDTLGDAEQTHIAEEIAYLSVPSGAGLIRDSGGAVIGEAGIASSVGTTYQTVALANTYTAAVVVATYVQATGVHTPAPVGVRNVTASSFEVAVRPAGAAPSAGDIHWVVVEAGDYLLPGGSPLSAGTVAVPGTNHDGDWSAARQVQVTPALTFTDPVVLGQVVTANDPRFSVFWASNGTTAGPPAAGAIYIGKHVAEDPTTARVSETVAYVIVESGISSGTATLEAGLSPESILGLDNTPPFGIPVTASPPQWTEGYRFGIQYQGSNGTGTAYPRPLWALRHISGDELEAFRSYSGQAWPAWVQSVDLSAVGW